MKNLKLITISAIILLMALLDHVSNLLALVIIFTSLFWVVGVFATFPLLMLKYLVWMFLVYFLLKQVLKLLSR